MHRHTRLGGGGGPPLPQQPDERHFEAVIEYFEAVAGRARARCRGRTRGAACDTASCAAGRTRRAASRWTPCKTSVAGGRAAARRPHSAAAVAIWRMLASHSGARRCANTHHGCTYCGCTVLGIASERLVTKQRQVCQHAAFSLGARLLISVVSLLASLVSPLAISLCLLASA